MHAREVTRAAAWRCGPRSTGSRPPCGRAPDTARAWLDTLVGVGGGQRGAVGARRRRARPGAAVRRRRGRGARTSRPRSSCTRRRAARSTARAPSSRSASACAARAAALEAREHLRAALDGFEALGAAPWAERARAELRASGQTARKRDVSTLDELTAQELQIAGLRRRRAEQPRRRGPALPEPAHDRLPPAQRVPQARHQLAHRARAARPRPRAPRTRSRRSGRRGRSSAAGWTDGVLVDRRFRRLRLRGAVASQELTLPAWSLPARLPHAPVVRPHAL